jgi:hypothetical protein
MKKIYILLPILALFMSQKGWSQCADLSFAAGCATPVTIDFTGFTGGGFRPTPSGTQLCSNHWAITGMSDGVLAFGGTQTAGDFARGSAAPGTRSTGGMYGPNALWIQPGGDDFTPGTITLRVLNNTGSTLSSVQLAYDILSFNDQQMWLIHLTMCLLPTCLPWILIHLRMQM